MGLGGLGVKWGLGGGLLVRVGRDCWFCIRNCLVLILGLDLLDD